LKKRKRTPPPRVRAKREKPKPILVEVHTKKWGSHEAFVQRVKAPIDDKGTVELTITMNVRETEFIQVRPVRRDFGDVAGLLQDAERLANQSVG
jgi:hypothetical protein